MKHPTYPIIASDNPFLYMFFSEGPRGKIRKGVSYKQIGKNIFNLGFGDLSENFEDLDDSSRSNNNDRDRILVTVALTAVDFTGKFPNARLFVQGSTLARTRLYQMQMAANLLEINKNFQIVGYINNQWEPFRSNRNYDSFLIERK